MSSGSFPGVKRPRRGVNHPSLSTAEVKEKVELYLYFPLPPAFMECYRANFTFFAQLLPINKATLNLRITALGLKHTYEQAGKPHILALTNPEDFAVLGCYVA
jgi:hypothetical protein